MWYFRIPIKNGQKLTKNSGLPAIDCAEVGIYRPSASPLIATCCHVPIKTEISLSVAIVRFTRGSPLCYQGVSGSTTSTAAARRARWPCVRPMESEYRTASILRTSGWCAATRGSRVLNSSTRCPTMWRYVRADDANGFPLMLTFSVAFFKAACICMKMTFFTLQVHSCLLSCAHADHFSRPPISRSYRNHMSVLSNAIVLVPKYMLDFFRFIFSLRNTPCVSDPSRISFMNFINTQIQYYSTLSFSKGIYYYGVISVG